MRPPYDDDIPFRCKILQNRCSREKLDISSNPVKSSTLYSSGNLFLSNLLGIEARTTLAENMGMRKIAIDCLHMVPKVSFKTALDQRV